MQNVFQSKRKYYIKNKVLFHLPEQGREQRNGTSGTETYIRWLILTMIKQFAVNKSIFGCVYMGNRRSILCKYYLCEIEEPTYILR